MELTLATWNVLHRVHAENWGEFPADRWPDEDVRIAAVTRRVHALVNGRDDVVVCLQEVSGDQLASLREALKGSGHRAHSFQYPRVPAPRGHATTTLRDRTEHLVTVAAHAERRFGYADEGHDPGKGHLAVQLGADLLIVNVHVSWGERRVPQLRTVAERAFPYATVVVAGDCNAPHDEVTAALGSGYTAAPLVAGSLPTRPRGPNSSNNSKSQAIDHVVVKGAAADAGVVVDVGGESDHNLVKVTLRG